MIWTKDEYEQLHANLGRLASRAEERASVEAVASCAVTLLVKRLPPRLRAAVIHYGDVLAEMPPHRKPRIRP